MSVTPYKGLYMYILLSITECVVIIPETWGGVFISLDHPVVVNDLPPEIQANTRVNFRNADLGQTNLNFTNRDGSKRIENYTPQQYEFFFDCGNTPRDIIEQSLALFEKNYEKSLGNQLADDDYPNSNPALKYLQLAFQEACIVPSPRQPRLFQSPKVARTASWTPQSPQCT